MTRPGRALAAALAALPLSAGGGAAEGAGRLALLLPAPSASFGPLQALELFEAPRDEAPGPALRPAPTPEGTTPPSPAQDGGGKAPPILPGAPAPRDDAAAA